jgi:4-aminobutyrate aminotransferase-like enzyme
MSNDKIKGSNNRKNGNKYLAFAITPPLNVTRAESEELLKKLQKSFEQLK